MLTQVFFESFFDDFSDRFLEGVLEGFGRHFGPQNQSKKHQKRCRYFECFFNGVLEGFWHDFGIFFFAYRPSSVSPAFSSWRRLMRFGVRLKPWAPSQEPSDQVASTRKYVQGMLRLPYWAVQLQEDIAAMGEINDAIEWIWMEAVRL